MEEEHSSMDEQSEEPRGSRTIYIIGAFIVLALIIAGISLPPISIWERLGGGGEETAEGEQVSATPETGRNHCTRRRCVSSIPGEIALNLNNGACYSKQSAPS